jgi:Ser-tRNA(Ala) deacylase AlaX
VIKILVTGAHLLSALFEQEYKFQTKAWWLGSDTTNIELNTKDISQQQLDQIEKISNSLIAQAVPVSASVYEPDDTLPSDVN